MAEAGYYGLLLETCKDIETFEKYNTGGEHACMMPMTIRGG